MIALLLANWKSILAAAATFALCLMLHKLDVTRIEAKHTAEIATVKAALAAECDKAQAITKGVSHAYQTKLADLNSRLSAAQRLYQHSCVAISGAAPAGHDAAPAGGKPAGRNVAADRLIDIAGKGEKYRIQLISCQSFVSLSSGQQQGR